MHAQFEHLAESYFDGFEHDLGERELGYAQSFDNDLDMFLASIALTKTAIEEVLKDEGEHYAYIVPHCTLTSSLRR